ncbi:uncharacterized protein VICG_00984 [Vittaforma corneae ATCC 50505]|uniref:Uncharacterized protein n=1 Tax=Vittaforma corneae (strain ATCC 50505) TaxID=993615 RepID=L2GNR8_VITCO|nr:uncharacterized protein VICG_00984 [Vittaforma corneae ATCC 50505]ELA41967.1 hypothetical protein VICG_00984 [Vittaforma corneae ATCC 50505]
MKVFISNNYGGEICKFEFVREEEDCFGFAVKINGFIETNSVRIQHLASTSKFVKDELYFKIPRNIIPTFQSKNFKVEYRADCTMVYKDKKQGFTFPINIFNNNIEDFNYRDPIYIELGIIEEDEFIKNRATVCRILLDNMNIGDNPLNYFNYTLENNDTSNRPESVSFIERKMEYGTPVSSPSIDLADLESAAADKQLKMASDSDTNSMQNNNVVLSSEEPSELFSDGIAIGNKTSIKKDVSTSNSQWQQSDNKDKKEEDSTIDSISEPLPIRNMDEAKHLDLLNSFPEQLLDEVRSVAENIVDEAIKQAHRPDNSVLEKCEKEDMARPISDELKRSLGQILSKMFEEKCKIESEMLKTLQKIQQNTRTPVFSERNVLQIQNDESSYVVMGEDGKLASIYHPRFIQSQSYVKIVYLKNVRNTQVQIWREDMADGRLIDAQSIYSVTFDSDNCLKKIFEFDIDGFTLKTFAFEVLYVLKIEMDGSEIRVPLTVLSPNTITSISN